MYDMEYSTEVLGKYFQKYSSTEYGLSVASILTIWVSEAKVWPQILYPNFEYWKYDIKYSTQILRTESMDFQNYGT